MEFLKAILGEDLFKQVESKINEHNGNEANKENLIKIANLASGEYVGKGKFDALQEAINGKDAEITNANNLIAELKKASKGNEEMQTKFTQYEQQNAQLQAELNETKIRSAIKVGLLSEHCTDVDYVTYKLMEKLKEKNESLELDENENIKGWNEKLAGLKTQLPTQFASVGSGEKKVEENRLPGSNQDRQTEPKTLAEALQMQFEGKE